MASFPRKKLVYGKKNRSPSRSGDQINLSDNESPASSVVSCGGGIGGPGGTVPPSPTSALHDMPFSSSLETEGSGGGSDQAVEPVAIPGRSASLSVSATDHTWPAHDDDASMTNSSLGGPARPRKAWEWHYRSFLSKRGTGGGEHHLGDSGGSPRSTRSASTMEGRVAPSALTDQVAPVHGIRMIRSHSNIKDQLDVRMKGGSPTPSSPIVARLASSPRSPKASPITPSGKSRRTTDSSVSLNASPASAPRPGTSSLSHRTNAFFDPEQIAAAIPPPPELHSFQSQGIPTVSRSGASLGVPKSFRKSSDSHFSLGPRAGTSEMQPHLQHHSAQGIDSSVRGGSFFKNMFKPGHSAIGSGKAGSSAPMHHAVGGNKDPLEGKAKSYDSLDSTVRRGNEVGHKPKGLVKVPVASSDRSRASTRAQSWDLKMHAKGNSVDVSSALGESPASLEPIWGAHVDAMRPGAGIGPNGNAKQKEKEDVSMKKMFTEFHNSKIYGNDSTSPYLGDDPSVRGMKKIFTEFHNSKEYGQDTTSPYLGEDPSVAGANHFAVQFSGGPAAHAAASSALPNPSVPSSNRPAVSSLRRSAAEAMPNLMRRSVLKPLARPETWLKDRRYLIGPAIAAISPTALLSNLPPGCGIGTAGSLAAAEAEYNHCEPYDRLLIGKVSVSTMTKDGNWTTPCTIVLMLRHNLLFEYGEGAGINEGPDGFAHLQKSTSAAVKNSVTDLSLEFYGSPCAGGDTTKLILGFKSSEDRDKWLECLSLAARLQIKDLYSYDASNGASELGRGRYSTIQPARRRSGKGDGDAFHDVGGKAAVLEGGNGSNRHSVSMDKDYDCALKIVNKNEFWSRVVKGKERADALVRETAVQATLSSEMGHIPTFLKIRNFFETIDHVVLELEILKGTDLFQHLSSKKGLGEVEAAQITRDLLLCVDAMKQVGIVHRDVKPANILMCQEGGIAVKLADFGMATFVGPNDLVRGRCGTPGYVAPEILRARGNSGYESNVDIFSVGVTTFVLLCGYEPFYGENDEELIKTNREAAVEYADRDWRNISIEGRDFVEKMLHPNPRMRITAFDALKHPWITRRAPTSS